jgi:hypothetical protein
MSHNNFFNHYLNTIITTTCAHLSNSRVTQPTASAAAKTLVSALNFEYDRMQKDLKFFPNIVAKLNFNISEILGERLADVLDAK